MICGKQVTLRAVEDRDVELLRGWRNHPDLMKYHFSTLPLSQNSQKQWYQNYSDQSNTLVYMIDNSDKHTVGYVLLKNLDHKNRNAEIGLYLDPNKQGKGYGKDAFCALIDYCFYELNLHRVCLEVFAFNQRAVQMYEKLGFHEEGRLRDAFFTQNQYHDIVVMSLLENEWSDHN
jgi:UDP-4-amino-4,6-dideoxy-N-acetyl-beta-L-altrosamine N-acetyltransferase